MTADEIIAWAARLGIELERRGTNVEFANPVPIPHPRRDEYREWKRAYNESWRAVLEALPDRAAEPDRPPTAALPVLPWWHQAEPQQAGLFD